MHQLDADNETNLSVSGPTGADYPIEQICLQSAYRASGKGIQGPPFSRTPSL